MQAQGIPEEEYVVAKYAYVFMQKQLTLWNDTSQGVTFSYHFRIILRSYDLEFLVEYTAK